MIIQASKISVYGMGFIIPRVIKPENKYPDINAQDSITGIIGVFPFLL